MNQWLLIILVMLIEALLHYFPWKLLLRGRMLPRLAAYTLGMLGLMVPFSAWLWQCGELEVMQTMWLIVSAGGLTVFGLYGLDHYLDLIMRDIEATEREQQARDAVHAKK